jgi:putative hydrolase of the HAD superfamily
VSQIRAIFFDAAGVFYDRKQTSEEYATQLLAQLGYAAELDANARAQQSEMRVKATEGRISHSTYWDQVLALHSVTNIQLRTNLREKILAHTHEVFGYQGAREAMAELKARGFILGLVTDTIYPLEWKMAWLAKAGVAEFVDVISCSTVTHSHKPEPEMYMNALRQAKLEPSEAAFVGHDARELDGAKRAGMTTVAVNYEANARADYYARSLMDLLNLPIFLKPSPNEATQAILNIEAIFLDVGNTLRVVVEDEPFQAQSRQQLAALIGATEPIETLFESLRGRWKAYRKWSFENLTEASEQELWTRFLLPDYPAEKIAPLAGKLTRLWRDKDGHRIPRPDVKSTVIELSRRGYCLGIIANTITETEIPDWLEADQLTNYFKVITLSSKVRYRKPGPEIYWEAARRAGVEPAHCVYVGDNPVRDVEGTRKAGFAMVIILPEPGKSEAELALDENKPDAVIHEFRDLLDIFPARQVPRRGN